MKNIIFIQGIFRRKIGTQNWKEILNKFYPNDNVVIFDTMYFYTQRKKISSILDSIEEVLKNGKETIIFAHSFGGILAIASYFRNLKKGRNNIKKIITMSSPHQLLKGGIKDIKNFLEYKNTDLQSVEIKTYGGMFDHIVFNKYSFLNNKPHQKMRAFHLSFLYSKKLITKIVKREL